jgi:hypothetical protein
VIIQTAAGKTLFDTGKIGERFKRAWNGLRQRNKRYDIALSGQGYMIDPDENDYRRISKPSVICRRSNKKGD